MIYAVVKVVYTSIETRQFWDGEKPDCPEKTNDLQKANWQSSHIRIYRYPDKSQTVAVRSTDMLTQTLDILAAEAPDY